MGNSQTKAEATNPTRGNTVTDEKDHLEDKLNITFGNLLKEGSSCLDEDDLKRLLDGVPILGSRLHSFFMSSAEGDTGHGTGISRDVFLSKGHKLLDLVSEAQKMEFYLQLFSNGGSSFRREDMLTVLSVCYSITLEQANLQQSPDVSQENPVVNSILQSMFGQEDTLSLSDVQYWLGRHIPRLLQCLHPFLCSKLCGQVTVPQAKSLPVPASAVMEDFKKGKHLLTLSSLWAVVHSIPPCYTAALPAPSMALTADGSSCLREILSGGGWQKLYDSSAHGLSVNRFRHHVFSYKAATLVMLDFNDAAFCVGVDQEWQQKTERWGEGNCFLLQVAPQYRMVQAGARMLYLNLEDRRYPKVLQVGKDAKTTVLQIDADFSKIKYFGVDYSLHRIEVWGCGGPAVREAQLAQQKWEHSEAEKQKKQKAEGRRLERQPRQTAIGYGRSHSRPCGEVIGHVFDPPLSRLPLSKLSSAPSSK